MAKDFVALQARNLLNVQIRFFRVTQRRPFAIWPWTCSCSILKNFIVSFDCELFWRLCSMDCSTPSLNWYQVNEEQVSPVVVVWGGVVVLVVIVVVLVVVSCSVVVVLLVVVDVEVSNPVVLVVSWQRAVCTSRLMSFIFVSETLCQKCGKPYF